MSKKIFLSYAHKDRAQLELDGLKEILEENGIVARGEEVSFIDPMSEFNSGETVRGAIKRNIQAASQVVVIATDESLSSQWVNYEIGMANALDKPITIVGTKGSGKTKLLASLQDIKVVKK